MTDSQIMIFVRYGCIAICVVMLAISFSRFVDMKRSMTIACPSGLSVTTKGGGNFQMRDGLCDQSNTEEEQ